MSNIELKSEEVFHRFVLHQSSCATKDGALRERGTQRTNQISWTALELHRHLDIYGRIFGTSRDAYTEHICSFSYIAARPYIQMLVSDVITGMQENVALRFL